MPASIFCNVRKAELLVAGVGHKLGPMVGEYLGGPTNDGAESLIGGGEGGGGLARTGENAHGFGG